MGGTLIMGRKTFESIGRPLPGRTNIVITRDTNFTAEGVITAHSVEMALDVAKSMAEAKGLKEVMVIGGAQIYGLLADISIDDIDFKPQSAERDAPDAGVDGVGARHEGLAGQQGHLHPLGDERVGDGGAEAARGQVGDHPHIVDGLRGPSCGDQRPHFGGSAGPSR